MIRKIMNIDVINLQKENTQLRKLLALAIKYIDDLEEWEGLDFLSPFIQDLETEDRILLEKLR